MSQPKILAFAGSTRTGSFNKQLITFAVEEARSSGAQITLIDLRDLPMPLYDGDLESASGVPENAKKFKTLLREHEGLLISSPEYNSSITGVLKNSIDWASRTESDDEPPLVCFRGKVAALMSASPGGLGGLRGLVHLRSILGNIGVIVLPDQVSISSADEAFDENGKLKDARKAKQVSGIAKGLAEFLTKFKGK
jgi:chromate reductase